MQSIHGFLNDPLNNYNGPVGDRNSFAILLLTMVAYHLKVHVQTRAHTLHSSFEKAWEASGLPDQVLVWVEKLHNIQNSENHYSPSKIG